MSQRSHPQPIRRQAWAHLTPQEILARYVPGRADPLVVLDVLIELFNTRHTALGKTVSYKTREQRALFLRRFFRDLQTVGGFKTLPDPRNLGSRHIEFMVRHWHSQGMSVGTIQVYLSYLRGLCAWTGRHGLVHTPLAYGITATRTEVAQRDKSWSGQGVDVDKKIDAVEKEDQRVGAALRLMFAFAMRCKEAAMFHPHRDVLPLQEAPVTDHVEGTQGYVHIKQGSKGGRPRFIAIRTPEQQAVVALACSLAASVDATVNDPTRSLKSNLRRFYYVIGKMGITHKEMNAASHGLRHETIHVTYEGITGHPPPVRGGHCPDRALDRAARLTVSRMAGHSRVKASSAYLGSPLKNPAEPSDTPNVSPPNDGSQPDQDQ